MENIFLPSIILAPCLFSEYINTKYGPEVEKRDQHQIFGYWFCMFYNSSFICTDVIMKKKSFEHCWLFIGTIIQHTSQWVLFKVPIFSIFFKTDQKHCLSGSFLVRTFHFYLANYKIPFYFKDSCSIKFDQRCKTKQLMKFKPRSKNTYSSQFCLW